LNNFIVVPDETDSEVPTLLVTSLGFHGPLWLDHGSAGAMGGFGAAGPSSWSIVYSPFIN
jgi:hypothetical protein